MEEENEQEEEEKAEEVGEEENNNNNQKAKTVKLTKKKKEQKRSRGVQDTSRGSCIWQNEPYSYPAASVQIVPFVLLRLSWIMWNYIENYEAYQSL